MTQPAPSLVDLAQAALWAAEEAVDDLRARRRALVRADEALAARTREEHVLALAFAMKARDAARATLEAARAAAAARPLGVAA